MIKPPIGLQELRRRMYRKAKSEKSHRFWGLFVHITKEETLEEAYRIAKRNGGAPGIDGQTFADIETVGRAAFLKALCEDLLAGNYRPLPNRKVEIPKENGKVRTLQIPCIRDRVVQGALKLILEAIFEADFCPNSHGYRPKRSAHGALAHVRRSVLRRMLTVIDVDLSRYFDTIRHSVLLDKIAQRIQDPQVLHLVKQIIKVGGKIGVPQGGPLSPLGVALNAEKTKVVNTLKDEAFGFLGFDLRRVRKREGDGYYLQMTPKKKARKAIKATIRDIIRSGGAKPAKAIVAQINAALAGLGQLLPGRKRQPCIQRSARLHGDEGPYAAHATHTAAKDQCGMAAME